MHWPICPVKKNKENGTCCRQSRFSITYISISLLWRPTNGWL